LHDPGALPFFVDMDDSNDEQVTAVLTMFNDAIDREIADRLAGDDAVLRRLDQVCGAPGSDLQSYGHDSVILWLRLVLASEHSPIGLAEGNVEDIAQETAANAIGDQPQDKVACLARCVTELEECDVLGEALINALRLCVADVRLATQMLRKWARADTDVIELVANTRRVLRRL
jgi:hypothetical protein